MDVTPFDASPIPNAAIPCSHKGVLNTRCSPNYHQYYTAVGQLLLTKLIAQVDCAAEDAAERDILAKHNYKNLNRSFSRPLSYQR